MKVCVGPVKYEGFNFSPKTGARENSQFWWKRVILLQISLIYFPGEIDSKLALLQVMAWGRGGDVITWTKKIKLTTIVNTHHQATIS